MKTNVNKTPALDNSRPQNAKEMKFDFKKVREVKTYIVTNRKNK